MAIHRMANADPGGTRVEVLLGLALLIVVVGITTAVLGNGIFGWATNVPDTVTLADKPEPAPGLSGDAPVSVNVPAAATVGDPDADACPRLLGVQHRGFDCSLPLYVGAMEKPRPAGKVKYFCADSTSYHLVGGQEPALHKMCVLTSAARAGH